MPQFIRLCQLNLFPLPSKHVGSIFKVKSLPTATSRHPSMGENRRNILHCSLGTSKQIPLYPSKNPRSSFHQSSSPPPALSFTEPPISPELRICSFLKLFNCNHASYVALSRANPRCLSYGAIHTPQLLLISAYHKFCNGRPKYEATRIGALYARFKL